VILAMRASAPTVDHEDLLLQTLQQRFSLEQFRPGQREVIEAVLAGRSLLAVMPTGAGKSLCYQLPAVLADAPTIVVSPLIALMKDQAEVARCLGIEATFINSHLSPDERTRLLTAACNGAYQLLYVAPERLATLGFLQQLRRSRWQTMVVDEAHCVSAWGHDFRPEYRRLPAACEQLGIQQVCAFTATATSEVHARRSRHERRHQGLVLGVRGEDTVEADLLLAGRGD
jgi:ATP-dependent DNA helicase RecQ